VRHWLHKPHVTISRPHTLTPQSSVAFTQQNTSCFSFTYSGGMKARVELILSICLSYLLLNTLIDSASMTCWGAGISNHYSLAKKVAVIQQLRSVLEQIAAVSCKLSHFRPEEFLWVNALKTVYNLECLNVSKFFLFESSPM